jgi:hypothetical protein
MFRHFQWYYCSSKFQAFRSHQPLPVTAVHINIQQHSSIAVLCSPLSNIRFWKQTWGGGGCQTLKDRRYPRGKLKGYSLNWGPGKFSGYSDSLRAGRSGDRIPVGGETFLTRPDRPWDPPSLLYNGYRVFLGSKAAGPWRWPPTPSSAEVKERVQL